MQIKSQTQDIVYAPEGIKKIIDLKNAYESIDWLRPREDEKILLLI